MARTIEQKSNLIGFPKAGELIEISGAHELEASDRAALNILYQHAHDSGRLAEIGAEWELPLSALRLSASHNANDRVRDSLRRLMRVVVSVPLFDSKTGEPREVLTNLFAYLDLSQNEFSPTATVRYAVAVKLVPVLARSNRWGRIKAEVVCAMTSKYAQTLYEMVQLRAHMNRCVETISIDRFRSLLGVPPGKLTRGNDLTRYVLEPALLEVNGLSDMGVKAELVRAHGRAPITAVTLAWWKKEGDEFSAAYNERQRSKIGRKARLRGTTEQVTDCPKAP